MTFSKPIHRDWEEGYYANVLWKLFDMGRKYNSLTNSNEHKAAQEVQAVVDDEIDRIVTQVEDEEHARLVVKYKKRWVNEQRRHLPVQRRNYARGCWRLIEAGTRADLRGQ